MRQSTSLLFKNFYEYLPIERALELPQKMRGLYVLYMTDGKNGMSIVYVGMTDSGAKGRILKHRFGKKEGLWTHCSVYEVWDNITQEQIAELEALFRHVLRKDSAASSLNVQKGSAIFRDLKDETSRRVRANAA